MKPRDPYDWEAWAWETIERAGDDLPGVAGLVLIQLAKHGNKDGIARPSARTLAGYLGRTDKPVRKALDTLVGLGLITGEKVYGKSTVWTLRADPVSAPKPPATADPVSAVGADEVRTNCGPTADPGVRTEGEGEGEETSLSLPTEAKDVREGEVEFDPRNIVPLRRLSA